MSDTEAFGASGDLGRLIETLSRQAEASRRTADLIESRGLPLLERIALALERAPATTVAGAAPTPILATTIDGLRDRIEAAKQANDPEGAMASRDELARVLQGEPFKEVDRSLAKWLIALIHKRLRTGTIRPEVADLAAQVAGRFGGTTEGASLRAALPTLRRSAGLCPRCGEPYPGLADACPKCLAPEAADPNSLTDGPDQVAPDPVEDLVGEPVDLNNERFWEAP